MEDSSFYASPSQSPSAVPSTAPSVPYSHGAEDCQWVLLLPRWTAMLSLLGVICVAMETWADRRTQKHQEQETSLLTSTTNSTVVSRSASRRNRNRKAARPRSSTRSTTAQRNAARMTQIQCWYPIPLVCQALGFVLGTAPAPHDQDQATRSAQGVLLQLGVYTEVCCGMSP